MYVSKGELKKILELNTPLERYSAEMLRELSDFRFGMLVTMQDLDEMLSGVSHTAAIPLLKMVLQDSGKDPKKIPTIVGTAVFKKDKMVGQISERETRGVLWLRNELKEYTVTIKAAEMKGGVSLNPVSTNIKLVPQIHNNEWKMLVKVKAEGAIVQNGTNLAFSNPTLLKKLEKEFQEEIKKRIELALQKVQHKLKADILGFAREYHRKYPKQWKKVENHWDKKFPTIKVKIDVEAQIRRQGYINKPGGVPEKEVREK